MTTTFSFTPEENEQKHNENEADILMISILCPTSKKDESIEDKKNKVKDLTDNLPFLLTNFI